MNISWTQGVNGNFATASNWNPAVVPGPGDDAIIGAKGTYTVTSSVAETVDSLNIADKHATLLIDGASSFFDTFGGVNDGTLVVDGSSSMFIGTNTTNQRCRMWGPLILTIPRCGSDSLEINSVG